MEPKRNNIYATHPGKFVWALYAIALNAARLPLWMILFIVPWFRQTPRWTWKQALRMKLVSNFL